MNKLNDEELEQVVGGRQHRISLTVIDGKIKISDPDSSKCNNAYYKSLNSNIVGSAGGYGWPCASCAYYQNGFCLNTDFLTDMGY